MVYSQPVSPSAKDPQPSTMEPSNGIEQTHAPDGNTTMARIIAFWKRLSTRNRPQPLPPPASIEPAPISRSPSPEPVVRSMDLLIMQAQVQSYAKTVCQTLLKCKVDGDKQNSS